MLIDITVHLFPLSQCDGAMETESGKQLVVVVTNG